MKTLNLIKSRGISAVNYIKKRERGEIISGNNW